MPAVIVGVCGDGTKELVALDDGRREYSVSWRDLLRDCKRRGMRTPVLAGADGARVEIWSAWSMGHPEAAARVFATDYGGRWSKAAAKHR